MDSEILSKGEQTRSQIVQAAWQLFLQQGYHGTSMRQIAAQTGIALGGIYNHFANKEDIFEAVYFAFHPYNQVAPAVENARGDTIEEMFRDIAIHMVEGLNRTPGFLNLMFIDIVEFQSRFTTRLLEKQMPFIEQIYPRLAQKGGQRLRPIPPLIVARSFFGLFFSYYVTGLFLNAAPNLPPDITTGAFDHFVNIYLHGILSENQLQPEDQAG